MTLKIPITFLAAAAALGAIPFAAASLTAAPPPEGTSAAGQIRELQTQVVQLQARLATLEAGLAVQSQTVVVGREFNPAVTFRSRPSGMPSMHFQRNDITLDADKITLTGKRIILKGGSILLDSEQINTRSAPGIDVKGVKLQGN